MFLILVAIVLTVFRLRKQGQMRAKGFRVLGAICLGALVIPCVIMGVVIASGAFRRFFGNRAILASASYTSQEPFQTKLDNVKLLLFQQLSDFNMFFASTLAAVVFFMLVWRGRISPTGIGELFWPFVVIAADCAVTLFCFFAAGKRFYHYTYLLIPPMGILFGLAFFGTRKLLLSRAENEPALSLRWRYALLGLWVIVISIQLSRVPLYLGTIPAFVPTKEKFGDATNRQVCRCR